MKGIVALTLSILVSAMIMTVYEDSALGRVRSLVSYMESSVIQLYHRN